jgi:signal transduction histidine kinase
MEARTEWTDARLNDPVERLDKTLDRLDQDVRELRSELRSEVSALRRDGMLATAALVAAIIATGILT